MRWYTVNIDQSIGCREKYWASPSLILLELPAAYCCCLAVVTWTEAPRACFCLAHVDVAGSGGQFSPSLMAGHGTVAHACGVADRRAADE